MRGFVYLLISLMSVILGFSPGRALAFGKSASRSRNVISGEQAKSFPYNMIGMLEAAAPDGTITQCTAVRVSRRVVLSAAHCFYSAGSEPDRPQGDEIGNHTYLDPMNGGRYQVIRFETGTRFAAGTNAMVDLQSGKDWAVAVLDDSIEGQSRYLKPLPENLNIPEGAQISASGFSMDIDDGDSLSEDRNCNVLSFSPMLKTTCKMWEGASGGPDLYTDPSGNIYVIGTHTLIRPKAKPPVALSTPISVFFEPLAEILKSLGE